jgi:hypothetical protein
MQNTEGRAWSAESGTPAWSAELGAMTSNGRILSGQLLTSTESRNDWRLSVIGTIPSLALKRQPAGPSYCHSIGRPHMLKQVSDLSSPYSCGDARIKAACTAQSSSRPHTTAAADELQNTDS